MRRLLAAAFLLIAVTAFAEGDLAGNSWATNADSSGIIEPGTTEVTGGTDLGVFFQSGGVITNGTGFTYDGSTVTMTGMNIGGTIGSPTAPFLNMVGGANATGFYNQSSTAFPNIAFTYKGVSKVEFDPAAAVFHLMDGMSLEFFGAVQGSKSFPIVLLGGNYSGFYSPANNKIGVVENQVEIVRFTQSGVKIDPTNLSTDPAYPLDVNGTAYISGAVGISTTPVSGSTLTVNGRIESLTGGIKFPDGSIQTTASISGSLTIGGAVSGGGANRVLYEDASENLAASANFGFNGSTVTISTMVIGGNLGSAAAPFLNVNGASDATGFYNSGSAAFPTLSYTYKGTQQIDLSGSNAQVTFNNWPLKFAYNGTSSSPNLIFNSNQTGIWGTGSGTTINLGISGTEKVRLTSTGLKVGTGANAAYALDVTGIGSFTGGILGTATNDNAASGNYGEYSSTTSVTFGDFGTSAQFGNVVSFSLTAGDWDVTACAVSSLNGAVMTSFEVAVSSFSANTTTDHVEGLNWLQSAALPVGSIHQPMCVPVYRVSLSGTTTIYLKAKAAYTSGPPQAIGSMTARRAR